MISKKIENLDPFHGEEGSEIKQIFDPQNTSSGIRFSLAQIIIAPGKSSILHKMKSAEVYFILRVTGLFMLGKKVKELKKTNRSTFHHHQTNV